MNQHLEANKKNAVAFCRIAFLGEPAKAVEKYVGNYYIQHNPAVADCPQAFEVSDRVNATLCIAAYAYLVAQRIEKPNSAKKHTSERNKLTVPKDYIARGSPEVATAY